MKDWKIINWYLDQYECYHYHISSHLHAAKIDPASWSDHPLWMIWISFIANMSVITNWWTIINTIINLQTACWKNRIIANDWNNKSMWLWSIDERSSISMWTKWEISIEWIKSSSTHIPITHSSQTINLHTANFDPAFRNNSSWMIWISSITNVIKSESK